MKKSLFLAAALCSSVAANAALSTTDFASNDYIAEWGRLKLVGNQLSSESGEAIQLKGYSTFSINYGEVLPCLSENAWDAMKMWGANIVRIAIYPSNANGSYSQSQDATIMKYIKWANDRGMYALVDWHVLQCDGGAGYGDPAVKQNEAKGMFQRISSQVKAAGYKGVLYEICNEPSGVSWDNIKSYADQVLPEIEAGDPGAIVIVGTPQWDQEIGQAVNSPISKSKYDLGLMYAFHFYACSHGYLIGRMTDASANIPVFVSEWGAVAFDGGGSFCESESNKFLGYLTKEGNGNQLISWCYWAWGAKDETSNVILPGQCGTYNESVLSTSGKYSVKILTGTAEIPSVPKPTAWETQSIPVEGENYGVLNVGYFDNGGPLVAYYDANSSRYQKDADGVPIRDEEHIDPNGTEAKCLNAGAVYGDWQNLGIYNTMFRYDEEVDVSNSTAGLDAGYGTVGDGLGSTDLHNLCMTEPGEWVNYTIDVKKKGYYKVMVLTTINTSDEGTIGLSICNSDNPVQNGNIMRRLDYYNDEEESEFYGMQLAPCTIGARVDGTIEPAAANENGANRDKEGNAHLKWGWITPEIAGERGTKGNVLALFKYEGVQNLKVRISPDDSGTPGDFSNIYFEYIDGMEIPEFEYTKISDDNTGVEALANLNESAIYPNPSNGEFTVKVVGEANVAVFNAVGAQVYNQNVNGDVTVNGLTAGIYTVRVSSAAGVKTIKAIVK